MGELLQQLPAFLTGSAVVIGALGLYRRRMAINAADQFKKINAAYQDLAQLHADTAADEHRKRLTVEAELETEQQKRRAAEAELERLKNENPDR